MQINSVCFLSRLRIGPFEGGVRTPQQTSLIPGGIIIVHPQNLVELSSTQKTLVVTPSNLWIKLNFCPFDAIGTPLESSESCMSSQMLIVFFGQLPVE